jgi:hypothetical protein
LEGVTRPLHRKEKVGENTYLDGYQNRVDIWHVSVCAYDTTELRFLFCIEQGAFVHVAMEGSDEVH